MSSLLGGLPLRTYTKRGFRRLTAPLRALPNVLVIGGMRCGTSSFFRWLCDHPDVACSSRKEIHFFDLQFHRGTNWYRGFFPMRGSGVLTFDATPSYMTHPLAASRAKDVVPDALLIALLRNPTDRAWSHYRYRRLLGTESRTFAQVVEDELHLDGTAQRKAFLATGEIPILPAGRYVDQLKPWLRSFGRDHILVLDANRMFESPLETGREVQTFLGMRRVDLPLAQRNVSPPDWPDADSLEMVDSYYVGPNRELQELIGATFEWME
ncbi:MAG: sulfotransferase domain-containing protein [Actinobacteria bacterium]|nr:sulfotransferase domain-containing protein [Actinomycetota bacterium]